MENQLAWVQSACARVLRPVVRLALTMGLKHPQLDELLRDLLLEEARRLWQAEGVARPNISQLSVTTGLNRKAVTAKVREPGDPLIGTEASAAAKAFTRWLQMHAEDPVWRRLPITGDEQAMSFEKLAREASRGNLHHRSILDELVRLKLVNELNGHAELAADGFVPHADMQTMLAFLGDNARDHLMAAVANVSGHQPPMLERAIYARGLSIEDCTEIEGLVRKRWNDLHQELSTQMTHAVDATGGQGAGRIRVGIYTYFEDAEEAVGVKVPQS
jgi:DNA-binding phage protein